MNKRLVAYMQGAVLLIEAACMTPALVIAPVSYTHLTLPTKLEV